MINRADLVDQILSTCVKKSFKSEALQGEKTDFSVTVTKEELISGRIQRHLDILGRVEKKRTRARNRVTLKFEGYRSDTLLEHTEIRNFLRRLFKIKPHAFYFLSKDSNLQAILLSLLQVDTGRYGNLFADKHRVDEFTFYAADITDHIRKQVEKTIRYANALKDPVSAQTALIEYLLDAFNFEHLTEAASGL